MKNNYYTNCLIFYASDWCNKIKLVAFKNILTKKVTVSYTRSIRKNICTDLKLVTTNSKL